MIGFTVLFSLVSFLAGVSAADPFFIVQHGAATFTTRVDPIISPGGISSHVHTVVGSSSFKNEYTYENNVNGKCTTANIIKDKSNYWIPQLYRKQDNGTFELVKMNRVNTYYLMRRQPGEKVHEFPPGIKMLAGSSKRSTYDDNDYSNNAISYTCLNYAGGTPDTHEFPEYSCPDDLRANLFFPNCWDGVNTWLEGSKHVAYPASGGHDSGGPCPATHPKRLMSLFYEFHFTDRYDYKPGARVWATGDDVGYSLHGDFTNGWPTGLFSQVFEAGDSCNVGFSIENCPVLEPIFTHSGGGTCTPDDPNVIINEDIGLNGPIPALPGNNPIWSTNGAPANPASPAQNATVPSSSAIIPGSSSAIATASVSTAVPSATTSPIVYISISPIGAIQSPPASSSVPTSAAVSASTSSTKKHHGHYGHKTSTSSVSVIGAINLVATASSIPVDSSAEHCKAKKRRLSSQF